MGERKKKKKRKNKSYPWFIKLSRCMIAVQYYQA